MASRTDGWRRRLPLSLLLVLALLAPVAQAADGILPGSSISQGSWQGGAFNGEDGRFSNCFVFASLGDYVVGFDLYRDASLAIFLTASGWTITEGSRTAIVVRVDQGATRNVVAEGLETSFFIDVGIDPGFLAALTSGRTLHFVAGGVTIPIDLAASGGGAAVRALEQCLIAQAGINAAGRPAGSGNPIEAGSGKAGSPAAAAQNPFAPPAGSGAPATGNGGSSVTSEDRDFVGRMLVQAGYPAPRFSDDEGGLAWYSDHSGIVGLLVNEPKQGSDAFGAVQHAALSVAELCGNSAQVLYDKTGRNSFGAVYSGRVDCPGSHVYFVSYELEQSVMLFAHIVPEPEVTLGQQLNANLRSYLLQF